MIYSRSWKESAGDDVAKFADDYPDRPISVVPLRASE